MPEDGAEAGVSDVDGRLLDRQVKHSETGSDSEMSSPQPGQ